MTVETPEKKLTKKDFTAPIDVRWCPGCGDYVILNAIQRTFPELGIPKENFVVVSGIGCSSRFPYYMNTYGFHTIHGRAPSVATGVKVANPELSVWMITGDGDGLSIGGNHLMHVLRRNVNINILLFNNRIYGLTKGQYSPTSEPGTKTKSSPMGSLDYPVNPLAFAIASEATFVARTTDTNPKHMIETFKAAEAHQGVSFVEIFQNCVIFNDKTFDNISAKDVRDDKLLLMEDGEPLLYGKERNKGLRSTGFGFETVTIGEDGITEADVLKHDIGIQSPIYAQALAQLNQPDFPVPMGVFRNVKDRKPYEVLVEDQMKEASSKKAELSDLVRGREFWEVD